MAILNIISLAIRLFALAWSLILTWRIRDWRIGFISGIVVLTAAPPIYHLIAGANAAAFTIQNPGIVGVAGSLFILFVVVMFQRAIQDQAETEKALRQTNDRLERARAELETRVQDRTASLRKSNEELRSSEEHYKSLFDQSNEALLLYTLDGRMIDANARALRLLGLPRSEILALTFPQLLSPEAQNDAEASIQKLASAGSCTFETILGRKGGEPFRAEVSASRSVLTG